MLLVFVTVVEKKNFTRAAEELNMTQPAVSQHIQNLERMIGSKLLERNNKYVRMNKAGEIVYHHAKEILGLYTRMSYLVEDLQHTAQGSLSIGASYTFGEYVLPHIAALLRKRYPLIKPKITIGNTREIVELVLLNRLDVGVIEGEYSHENLIIEPVAEDQMYIVCSSAHRLAQLPEVTADELGGETWIIREAGSGTREAAEKLFSMLKLDPADIMQFGSTQIIKESVEAGLGISLLSHWAIRKEVQMGRLISLKTCGLPFRRSFSLVTLASPFHTKATEVFVQILRNNEGYPDSNL